MGLAVRSAISPPRMGVIEAKTLILSDGRRLAPAITMATHLVQPDLKRIPTAARGSRAIEVIPSSLRDYGGGRSEGCH